MVNTQTELIKLNIVLFQYTCISEDKRVRQSQVEIKQNFHCFYITMVVTLSQNLPESNVLFSNSLSSITLGF